MEEKRGEVHSTEHLYRSHQKLFGLGKCHSNTQFTYLKHFHNLDFHIKTLQEEFLRACFLKNKGGYKNFKNLELHELQSNISILSST